MLTRRTVLSTKPIHSIFQSILPKELGIKGSLFYTPAYLVLLAAEAQKFTGKIIFVRGERKKRVDFQKGLILALRTNLVAEGIPVLLGKYLLPLTEISQIQTELSVESRGFIKDSDFLKKVSENKLLSPGKLDWILKVQQEEIILNLLGWFEGEYSVEGPKEVEVVQSFIGLPSEILNQVLETLTSQPESSPFEIGKDFSIPLASEFRPFGAPLLLFGFCQRQPHGNLLLEKPNKRKLIQYKNGNLESVSSTDPKETLLKLMERNKQIDEFSSLQIETEAQETKLKIRDLLVEKKAFLDTTIQTFLNILRLERILEILGWRSGKFSFQGELQPILEKSTLLLTQANEVGKNYVLRTLQAEGKNNVVLENSFPEIAEKKYSEVIFHIQQNQTEQDWVQNNLDKIPEPLRQKASFIFEDAPPFWKLKFRSRPQA